MNTPDPAGCSMNDETQRGAMVWEFPIPRTHCGVALGNGNFGMLVWGDQRLHLTVNRADFWDHRNGEVVPEYGNYEKVKNAMGTEKEVDQFCWFFNDPDNVPRWKSFRLPMGRFELELADGVKLNCATLDLDSGCLGVEAIDADGTPETLALAMAMDENIVAIRDPSGMVKKVHVRTAWEWPKSEEGLLERKVPRPDRVDEDDVDGWIQPLPEDPSMAALCRKTAEGYLVCLARGDDNAAAKEAGLAIIKTIDSSGMDSLFAATGAWWADYWQDVPQVELPSEFFNRFLSYCLYKFGCATAPESPIPSGLQGPWAEEYQMTPWNGDYHFNVNIQQIYTLAFAANRPQHLLPLFNMLESEEFHAVMRQTAKRLYGVDDGLVITHAVDDRGRQVGGMSAGSVLDQACGGWTAQLYWLYYQHTGDVEFLRNRAYPFIRGMMRAYEGMLEKVDGKYRIPVSISAEYRYTDETGKLINYGPDPSYQLACIHMLLNALFQACDVLEIEPLAEWVDIRENLPHYALVEGAEGPMIAVWEGKNLDECHRHHSHLASIYPFDSLGEWDEETMGIIDNSIDHWIAMGMGRWSEWCIPWAAIIQSRLGFKESPRILLEMWKEVFVNEGLTTVYLPRFRGLTAHRRDDMVKPKETNEVMQLDGTMGGATAIYEMLAHCRGGIIRIFPAVSERWQDISFRGIGVPGPATVSAERVKGRTRWVEIESRAGGTFSVDIDDLEEAELYAGSRIERVALPVEIEVEPGGKVKLCRFSSRDG